MLTSDATTNIDIHNNIYESENHDVREETEHYVKMHKCRSLAIMSLLVRSN